MRSNFGTYGVLLTFIHPAVLLLLIGRAAFSSDPIWRRAAAVAVVGVALLSPHIFQLLGGRFEHYSFVYTGSRALAGAYLFSWAFRSRDYVALRAVSGLLGLAVLIPLAFVIVVPFLILYGS